MSLKSTVLLSVLIFSLLSLFLFIQHEIQISRNKSLQSEGEGEHGKGVVLRKKRLRKKQVSFANPIKEFTLLNFILLLYSIFN
jgi:hypothetical protein